MKKSIETIRNLRKSLLTITEGLTVEQLNEVPAGFNNNIIWNLGHVVAAQQSICYKRTSTEIRVDEAFFNTYKPDTKPDGLVDIQQIEKIKELLLTTVDQLETDYTNTAFGNYIAFTTRYGVPLSSVDEAIDFLPFHEGFHLGYIAALKHVISK